MKILVVYAALFLAMALAAPADEKAKPADEKVEPAESNGKTKENEKHEKQRAENEAVCREKSGTTVEQIEFLRKEPKSEQPQSAKCYINCIAERIKDGKDGELKKDTFDIYSIDGITKEQAEQFAKECSVQKADDPCEQSYQTYVCFTEKSDKFRI